MFGLYLLSAAILLASYLYARLNYVRFRQYAHIPQLPNHLLWGHLKTFGKFMQRGKHDRHPGMLPDHFFYYEGDEIYQNYGLLR